MTLLRKLLAVFALAVLYGQPGRLTAQANEDCLTCHSDNTLTKKRNGKTVSLFVDQAKFEASIHGKQLCVDCHVDLKGKDLPHDETLKPANCGSCHATEQQQHSQSLHGKAVSRGDPLAPRCADCHGNHAIVAKSDPRSPVPLSIFPTSAASVTRKARVWQRQRAIHQDHIRGELLGKHARRGFAAQGPDCCGHLRLLSYGAF